MIKSSAYLRAVICSLFKHDGRVLTLFSLQVKRSLTYMLNTFGLNGHPCRKPFELCTSIS